VERPRAGETRPSGAAPLIPEGLDAILVLLRHGETEFIVQKRFQGQMEAPLSKAGELQARLAARRLASPRSHPPLPIPDAAPFAIVHSPLERASRTAEYVAEALAEAGRTSPPLRPEPGLSEIAQGEWEGLTDSEISARFGDSLAGWRRWPTRFHAPGGENLDQVASRVEGSLTSLLGELADGGERGTLDRHQVLGYEDDSPDRRRWALVVGHGGVFRVVICLLLGLPLESFWSFDFGLAAISVVEIRAGRAVLRALNLDAHLGPEGERTAAEAAARDASGAL
jgi:probable phosphoglycerate mutase